MRADTLTRNFPRRINPFCRWSLTTVAINTIHAFLPSVTLKQPHWCPGPVADWHIGRRSAPNRPCNPAASIEFSRHIKEVRVGLRRRVEARTAGEVPPTVRAPIMIPSIGLPAQEGRDIELVLVRRIMHRSLPAVRIEALVAWAFCVVGHRLRLSVRGNWRGDRWPRRCRDCAARASRSGSLLTAAEADRRQPLQQSHTPLFRCLGAGALPRLIRSAFCVCAGNSPDAGHPPLRAASARPARAMKAPGAGSGGGGAGHRLREQRRLPADRPDGDVLAGENRRGAAATAARAACSTTSGDCAGGGARARHRIAAVRSAGAQGARCAQQCAADWRSRGISASRTSGGIGRTAARPVDAGCHHRDADNARCLRRRSRRR